MIAAISNTKALWYLTRGTGVVSLLLLTLSVVLGITEVTRWTSARFPRFVTAALHKNVSLMVIVFLGVHIVTAIADGFAPIGWLDAVVPFRSPYRPLWLGLGAVAFDLLVALIVTSLLRQRIGYRAWRAVHWAAYASFPVALLHGLGTGSDTRSGWMLLLSLACLACVAAGVWWRIGVSRGASARARVWAGVGALTVPAFVVVFTIFGPLAPNWSRRAGTPTYLFSGRVAARSRASLAAIVPFDATVAGTVTTSSRGDRRVITINARLSAATPGTVPLRIVLAGLALDGGGVEMQQSEVTLGNAQDGSRLTGVVVALQGSDLRSNLHDAAGHSIALSVHLDIDPRSNAANGTASSRIGTR